LWWKRNKKGNQHIKYVKSISPVTLVTLTKKPEEALIISYKRVMELVNILDDSYQLLPVNEKPKKFTGSKRLKSL
jgi:hypothetical protein